MDIFKRSLILFIQKIVKEKNNTAVSEKEAARLIKNSPDNSFGDYSIASYYFGKYDFKGIPVNIAKEIFRMALTSFDKAKDAALFDKIEMKDAYVNFFVNKKKFAYLTIKDVLSAGTDYGREHQEKPLKVVIDFSSPNIAKPFGVGHLRSTVIGMSLSNIYEFCGHSVVKVNYLGDFGTQFGKLITAFCRYDVDFSEFNKDPINVLYGLYVRIHKDEQIDETLEKEAKRRFKTLENFMSRNRRSIEEYLRIPGNTKNSVDDGWKGIEISEKNKGGFCETESGQYNLWKLFRGLSIDEFKRIYKSIGIEFDVYEGEAQSAEFANETTEILLKSGIASISEGAVIIRVKGVKAPALIAKSDGTSLYLSRDIVTAVTRMAKYSYDKMIYVVGSEQSLHFSQLSGIFRILKDNADKISENPIFKSYASLIDGRIVHVKFGRIIGMSTRKGNLVFLNDYIEEASLKAKEKLEDGFALREASGNAGINPEETESVALKIGIGAVMFNDLKTRRTTDVSFNWDNVLSFEGQTGPYLQYTISRINSLMLRLSPDTVKKERGFGSLNMYNQANFDGIFNISEEDADFNDIFLIIKQISYFKDAVDEALNQNEPSVISSYALELSALFNKYYQNYRLLGKECDYIKPRLYIIYAMKIVLMQVLRLLCIPVIERM
ncbi:arginine--tRNA ligase [Candidatus Acidulodesulfobacterium sp. H_13]|uniref:arginine--tRNA ligase n=1 Tax=Candidatus Acidulodesulfobacterium sp. H_13 TaxID=3395470 RepID=UPI003AF6DF91